ncbi:hypothetical protein, partial [Microcoleus sp. herbarium12]|uniref:hypothetical protein n=1 Tax=Microcoleus sp. herbarium12 TaxID=3055437 RepID=UPI002FD0BEAB
MRTLQIQRNSTKQIHLIKRKIRLAFKLSVYVFFFLPSSDFHQTEFVTSATSATESVAELPSS